MTNILLISEDFIKEQSNLNDNLYGKLLLPAIREAQDIGLQTIIGSCLYKKLLDLVDSGDIAEEEYVAYKDLLDNKVQDYLLYKTLANINPIINVKLANAGTVLTNDEHLTNLTQGEADLVEKHYQNNADFYAKRLQAFLKANREAFPELECDCICAGEIKPTLDSASSCSIYLGGTRGK